MLACTEMCRSSDKKPNDNKTDTAHSLALESIKSLTAIPDIAKRFGAPLEKVKEMADTYSRILSAAPKTEVMLNSNNTYTILTKSADTPLGKIVSSVSCSLTGGHRRFAW